MLPDFYDIDTEPVVTLEGFYGPKKHLLDRCLIIFSYKIHNYLLTHYSCTKIGEMDCCNGKTTIYSMNYKGEDVAFYLTPIGSALAGDFCYESHWLTGATKYIMFGSCGSLASEKTAGKYIVPTESYRGEGMSFYFAPAADYITIKNSDHLAAIFEEMNIPYVQGRVWTTDCMFRETQALCAKRREEGCIAVEMELAGVQAVCDFHGLELYDFLQPGDVLGEETYDAEGLSDANHSLGKLKIALEVALKI